MPLSQTVFEVTLEVAAILPIVLSVAIWFPSLILSFIEISICKFLRTLAMLQTLFEFSLISIPIDPDMHPIAFSFAHPPLPDIAVSFTALPHPRTMFESIEPLPLIKLSVWPTILPHPFRLPIHIGPLIH